MEDMWDQTIHPHVDPSRHNSEGPFLKVVIDDLCLSLFLSGGDLLKAR